MGMRILMDLLSSKDGDELFEKVEKLLGKFGFTVYDWDGNVKNLHSVCCDVVEIWNKER
jgi:hypothetical protein